MDGKFPECSLFLETLPSLLSSISAMVETGEGMGQGWRLYGRTQYAVLTYVSITDHHVSRASRDKVELCSVQGVHLPPELDVAQRRRCVADRPIRVHAVGLIMRWESSESE